MHWGGGIRFVIAKLPLVLTVNFSLLCIVISDRSSPFPKFDKAVSELHEWLDTIEDMMRTEKIVLGDKEDMDGLVHKQKVNRYLLYRHGCVTGKYTTPKTPKLLPGFQ